MTVLSAAVLFGNTGVPIRVKDATALRPTDAVIAESVKVAFTISGWGRVSSGDESVTLSEGTVLTIPPGVACQGFPVGWTRTVTMYMHAGYLSDQVRWLADAHPLVHQLRSALSGEAGLQSLQFPLAAMQALAPRLARWARLPQHAEHEFTMLASTAEVFDAVGRLAGTTGLGSESSAPSLVRPRDEVIDAITVLRRDLAQVWRMDVLANHVALSPSQLNRLFRVQVGVSPAAYLARLRADRMADLLSTTSMSVGEIGTSVGWPEPSVASRAFKRRYGVSPRGYAARTTPAPLWTSA